MNGYIIPILAVSMLLTGCDDQIMKWGRPDGENAVTSADIPLAVKEVIANYDNIKVYAKQYTPNIIVGLGCGADLYASNYSNVYQTLTNDNFQMLTPGNALKMDAVMKSNGSLDFTAIDAMIGAMPSDMHLYGHNFIWYQQQQQTYLKSLIAPTMVISGGGDIANILKNGTFDSDLSSWGGWGNSSTHTWNANGGPDGSGCAELMNPTDASEYSAQFVQDLNTPLEVGKTYIFRFKAKGSVAGIIQFAVQNSSTYAGEGYRSVNVTTDWNTYEVSYTCTKENMDRMCINFGKVAGTYLVDDVQFGEKIADKMTNMLLGDASDFEGGTAGNWSSWGSGKVSQEVKAGAGKDGSYGVVLTNKGDGNAWDAQFAYTFSSDLDKTKSYIIQFWAKSSTNAGALQLQYQNGTTYKSQGGYNNFTIGTEWAQYEYTFTPGYDDVNRIILNFGKVGGTYYIDNIKFGPAIVQSAAMVAKKYIPLRTTRADQGTSSVTYNLKTPSEKRTALLGAMDSWIKGVAEHLSEKKVVPYGYDVINEPIADETNKVRGVDDGTFGGSTKNGDGTVTYDSEPTESTTDGLNLNWGTDRFYWGYYVKDYAIQAFQKARKYLPAETKLFINDYNLETSPTKLAALIKFVKQIDTDNGSSIVDGIGTEVHFDLSAATDNKTTNDNLIATLKTKVDVMFKTLAATGKFIRVTELDVALGTSSPSSAQYECQAECYRMIFRSYLDNIPSAQQSGITIWTLSDNDKEHTNWLKGDVPNVFDGSYKRKWAYKGVCDGIANQDLGLKFGGDDYKVYYEKNNVSGTVSE
ncbi:MAG: endo-1,4-beta-xylanase [Prevotella sp.]|nr:endo-1,4-beta-xylanase [Prevotella sp.]